MRRKLSASAALYICLVVVPNWNWALLAQADSHTTLRSIDSLSAYDTSLKQAVLLRGVVTLSLRDTVFVQDQTGAIEVRPVNPPPLALGDEVELVGVYSREGEHPSILNASMTRLWSGSQPVPLALTPEQAAEGGYRSQLIEVEGRLLQKQTLRNGATFAFEGEHQFFAAQLDISSPGAAPLLSQFDPGSTLRVTGVCSLPPEKSGSSPVRFTVLLRSADDIRVLSPPPWWSLRHLTLIAIACIAGLFLFHRIHIHNLNLRFRAVMEERSRLAREMHDTLAQGFSGVALQLENLVDELQRSTQTASAYRQLDLALRMVRHSREEASHSIFVLRSLAKQNLDLLKAIALSARLKSDAHNIEISTRTTGDAFELGADTVHNLIRIGQEAIVNAIRHAGASKVELLLAYSSSSVTLSVIDNGRGFDIDNANSTDTGHFGLTGMRERAARINAVVQIVSAPGSGTSITATAPKSPAKHSHIMRSVLSLAGRR